MYKSAINASGFLLEDAAALANVISVSSNVYQRLAGILGTLGVDHTYMQLGDAPNAEIIRVKQVNNVSFELIVDRAVEGTTAKAYPAATSIAYVLTENAIMDIINATIAPTLTITAMAPLVAEVVATNTYELSLTPLALGSNNESVLFTGTWPNIDLAVNPASNGCCS